MKLVVVMFVMTMTSLKVFKKFVQRQIFNCKKIVDGKMFNCKMTEEPTMATAEEAAPRVYAKKLAADRESKKRKRAEESQEQQENRLALIEKVRTESVPKNHKSNMKTGLDRDTNDDRDRGNINDDRDTQREITDWDTGIQMTTRTQGI